jgi:hypothetical protein
MPTTFLHEDKPLVPDEVAGPEAPRCDWCETEMWLMSVSKTISDMGIVGEYTYECGSCRAKKKVDVQSENPSAAPMAGRAS